MTQLKNFKWLGLCLATISVLTILANAPLVQAQSSAQLSVLQSDANRIVLELSVSGYDSREVTIGGRTFTIFSIGDLGQTGESGSPQLPVKGAMIGIPPGAQASFQIIADDSRTVLQSRPPLPVPTQQIEHDPRTGLPIYRADSYEPNPATFSANQFYPAQPAKIGGVGNWRSQHYATVQFFPLQYNPASHQLVFHRRVRVEIALSYPRGQSPAALGQSVNEGAFESVFQNAFANHTSAKNWRARPALVPSRRAPRTSSVCPNATGPCYKIGVNADGIYKVACNQLPSMTQPITASAVQMFKQGTEIAINVSGGWGSSCTNNDFVEFYGLAATGKYTTTNIYWLTYGNAITGKRMTTRAGTPGIGTAATSFTKTVHLEQNFIYRPNSPQIEGYEHWYWQYLAPYTGVSTQDYTFQINHVASSNLSPTLLSNLVGADSGSHHTKIWLNSCSTMDDGVWSGSVERITTLTFPDSCLNPITNTLHITESNEANFYDVIFTNYFDVSYQSAFDATNDSIRFQQPVSNTWRYSINGFTNANIETFDVADPFDVTRIINFNVTGTGPYQLQFEDAVTTTARTYLALTTAQRITPTTVVKDAPSNLLNGTNGADYIIISASSFVANAQRQQLKNLRATQFARVQLIDAQDIYDEFNDGMIDPQAIHDFLQYAFTYWTPPAPQFVLLVGAGNADPKSYCLATANPCNPNQYQTPPNSTLIPPYLRIVEPYAYGETNSDNCLVVFSGTCNLTTHSLPEMFLGRLPADTTADLTALVN